MTLATDRKITLNEFLTYDDGSDRSYELVDGVLVEMATESTINLQIAIFLIELFLQLTGRKFIGIKHKIEVPSRYVTARDADLIIHSPESAAAIEGRTEACLYLHEPNPRLIIEVVSPGKETSDNYKRDYQQKPKEYAERGIPEFWRIDPSRNWVQVLILENNQYQTTTFMGNDAIVSPTFPTLAVTAQQILTAN